jgi:hypothetical protein
MLRYVPDNLDFLVVPGSGLSRLPLFSRSASLDEIFMACALRAFWQGSCAGRFFVEPVESNAVSGRAF